MHDFNFNSGNLKLDGTIFYPPHKKDNSPAILFVHGWTSERKRSLQYAKALSELGYICLLFDMRGHGTSKGDINTFTNKEFLDDCFAAYDYLVGIEGVDSDNISAVGSSFGSYLVSLLTKSRRIKNIVLRVPADYPNETFNKIHAQGPDFTTWRNEPKQPNETYALEALNNFEGNVLIIESEKDDNIPHQTILNYMNAAKDKSKLTHILMEDAPHSIKEGKFRDEVTQILVKWFENKL